MAKGLLILVAVTALIYGVLSLPEMLLVSTRNEATVWQQISARLAIGLSLLIFSAAAGLAAILGALERGERSAAAGIQAIIAALGETPVAAEPQPGSTTARQFSKAEERRQRLAERMGVTLPTEEEEKAALAAQEAGEITLKSGFVIREKPRTKDALDQAVEQLYNKPPALR